MKKSIALLSLVVLVSACKGGAGGAAGVVSTTGTNTSGNNNNNGGAAAGGNNNNGGNVAPTNAEIMAALVNAINTSPNSVTRLETVGAHDAGDGVGYHELGTITLKCTPELSDLGVPVDYITTYNSSKYIVNRGVLCVPQKDNNFNILTSVLPELAAYARAGAIDYLVTPGTFSAAKFHYAAIQVGCKLPGPITRFDDLSAIDSTCNGGNFVINGVPYTLTLDVTNFRNGYYGNSTTFAKQYWRSSTVVDSQAQSWMGTTYYEFDGQLAEKYSSVTHNYGFAAGTVFDPSLLSYNAGVYTYNGTNYAAKGLIQAHYVALYNGLPRLYTKIDESFWATLRCQTLNCSVSDVPLQ